MVDTPGKLIAFRNDRLGARLLTLINAMRLSTDYGVEFAVYWPFAVDVTAVFNDATELFDAGFVAERFIDRDAWQKRRTTMGRIGDVARGGPDMLWDLVGQGRDIAVDQAFGINVLEGEDPIQVKQAFLTALAALPFAPALQAPLAAINNALDGAVAYHIRRGDLTDGLAAKNKPWPHKMVPNEFYELHMEAALGDGPVQGGGRAILFSDDGPTLDHYTSSFPGLRTIHDIVDLDNMTEAQRDFIELWAMSRCAKIIAPERSAFSSTAVELGHAVKRSVTEDMTPEMSDAAHERLIARLHERPDSFSGDGEIGQSLAHVGPWLEKQERWAEAGQLFGGQVAAGLNIAFIYPDAMRYQHKADDVDGVLKTARHMFDRYVYHVRYFVDAEMEHGYAHFRKGDRKAAMHHIANGFWHSATGHASRILIPALVQRGVLTAANFLPVSPLQLSLHRRRGPLKHMVMEYPEIVRAPDVGLPDGIANIDTAIWDFAPLLRSVSLTAAKRSGAIKQARLMLQSAPVEDVPEQASLLAVLDAFDGDVEVAWEKLTSLTKAHPEHVMTWQRLSHAYAISKKFGKATEAAEQAAALGKGIPMIQAWCGMLLLRTRKHRRAARLLARADAPGIGLPIIPALLAKALDGEDAPEEALAAIDRAISLAPMDGEFSIQRSALLDRLDRLPDAVAELERMVELYRAPGKMFRTLVDLLTRMNQPARADDMVRICQERYPDHPITRRMIADRAA
ncbi:MAG: hypothetical protein AB8B85_04295 [Paracoccaceae bacterium]